jgi:PAS domain S-box-containing protein
MISQAIGGAPSGQGRSAAIPQTAAAEDPIFSGLAALASAICESPLASVTVIGHGESWCMPAPCMPATEQSAASGQRPDPFARYTSQIAELFDVADTTLDPRFRESGYVIGGMTVRSYAGLALRSAGGELLGTLAVYDVRVRTLSAAQRASLGFLAAQAVAAVELRSQVTAFTLLSPAPDAGSDRALLESAPVAIYRTDAAGNMKYSNPEYRRMFGLEPGHSPNDWAERVHPGDRVRMERAWADFCLQPVPCRFGYRTQAEDGSIRHLSEQVVPVDGMSGWIGTISDFTDLVTARDNLRKTETMFRNTFDQAPIGIAYADRGGKILRCNHTFWTLLGFDPGDLTDRTMSDVTHRDDVARVLAELERLWSGDLEVVDLEKRYTCKDGRVIWVRMTTALVREGDASPEYSVEFLRDITARKESAEELERVHKQLMIASRQAGMAEVATNVLHNVGNILNSVNISASLVIERVKQSKAPGVSRLAALLREKGLKAGEFLDNDERGKRIPEYLNSLGEQLVGDQKMALEELASLRDNLEHIKDTVAMQQSYAKLCGVTETIEVVDLVEDSLRLNAGAFVRHGVTLHREFNEVPPITVDKHKVLQILVNLVRNAKYACDESGKSDKLITLRIETAPAGVRILVIDNGVGIPAENMARLFTHGFTTRVDGHGFGLHSGALAAHELGGSLCVSSDGPGRGAVFTLELPCTPAGAAHV